MKASWKVTLMGVMCTSVLLAALASTFAEQREAGRLEARATEATVRGKAVGQVLIGGSAVMTFHVSAAGLSPARRAEIVADRLNQVFSVQVEPRDFLVAEEKDGWSVKARGMTIVTATAADAKAMNTTSERLSKFWRDSITDRLQTALREDSNQAEEREVAETREATPAKTTSSPQRDQAEVSVPVGRKIVPILSLGQGLHIGAAEVVGPRFRVDDVKAVAQIEGNFNRLSGTRIRAMVPISTEKIVSNLARVEQVAVSKYGDVDPRRIF